jgi:hypothetical protein
MYRYPTYKRLGTYFATVMAIVTTWAACGASKSSTVGPRPSSATPNSTTTKVSARGPQSTPTTHTPAVTAGSFREGFNGLVSECSAHPRDQDGSQESCAVGFGRPFLDQFEADAQPVCALFQQIATTIATHYGMKSTEPISDTITGSGMSLGFDSQGGGSLNCPFGMNQSGSPDQPPYPEPPTYYVPIVINYRSNRVDSLDCTGKSPCATSTSNGALIEVSSGPIDDTHPQVLSATVVAGVQPQAQVSIDVDLFNGPVLDTSSSPVTLPGATDELRTVLAGVAPALINIAKS